MLVVCVTTAGLLAGCGSVSASTTRARPAAVSFSEPAFAGARITGMAFTSPGCVAVGVSGPPAAAPASWASVDCGHWERSPTVSRRAVKWCSSCPWAPSARLSSGPKAM